MGLRVPDAALPSPSPPSLDFSYQEQPEGSGSELEEVRVLQPPSSEGRAG